MDAKIRKALEKPFSANVVKTRDEGFGTYTYVEGHAVIQRMNEVFSGDWGQEVVKSWPVQEDGKTVAIAAHVRITIWTQEKEFTNSLVKEAIGIAPVFDKIRTSHRMGEQYKVAVTDAFKKCCVQLGVGLCYYTNGSSEAAETELPKASPAPPPAAPSGVTPVSELTDTQAAIKAITGRVFKGTAGLKTAITAVNKKLSDFAEEQAQSEEFYEKIKGKGGPEQAIALANHLRIKEKKYLDIKPRGGGK